MKEATVYVEPFAVVLYDAMSEPYAFVAVITTLNFDNPLMNPPYVSAYPMESVTATEQEGFTLEGIEQVTV